MLLFLVLLLFLTAINSCIEVDLTGVADGAAIYELCTPFQSTVGCCVTARGILSCSSLVDQQLQQQQNNTLLPIVRPPPIHIVLSPLNDTQKTICPYTFSGTFAKDGDYVGLPMCIGKSYTSGGVSRADKVLLNGTVVAVVSVDGKFCRTSSDCAAVQAVVALSGVSVSFQNTPSACRKLIFNGSNGFVLCAAPGSAPGEAFFAVIHAEDSGNLTSFIFWTAVTLKDGDVFFKAGTSVPITQLLTGRVNMEVDPSSDSHIVTVELGYVGEGGVIRHFEGAIAKVP